MTAWGYEASVERKTPPGQMPMVLEVRTGRSHTFGALLIGGIMLIAGAVLWQQNAQLDHVQEWMLIPLVALAAFGGLRVFRALRGSGRQATYRIGADAVTAEGTGGTWTEPLSAYRGVRWRRERLQRRNNSSSGGRGRQMAEYLQLIELVHDDPARTVPLLTRRTGRVNTGEALSLVADAFTAGEADKDAITARAESLADDARGAELRGIWEGFARDLGVPAIDARDGAEVVRDAEDVDSSISELAQKGKISGEWDGAPPPKQLELIQSGDPNDPASQEMTVVVRAPRLPIIAIFGGIGALTFVLGLVQFALGLMVFGAAFVGAAWFMYWIETNRPPKIHLTRTHLRYERPNQERRNFDIPLAAIETIAVVRNQSRGSGAGKALGDWLSGGAVMIATDDRDHRIGDGLDAEALEWLRRFLVSAVANA